MGNNIHDGSILLSEKGKPLLHRKHLEIKGASKRGEERNKVSKELVYIPLVPLGRFVYK